MYAKSASLGLLSDPGGMPVQAGLSSHSPSALEHTAELGLAGTDGGTIKSPSDVLSPQSGALVSRCAICPTASMSDV